MSRLLLPSRRVRRARKAYVVPSRSDVHVDRPLTNLSLAYMQEVEGFVADQAFPIVPVDKQSDRYFEYPRGAFNLDEMQKRAPGTRAATATYEIDNTPSYFCTSWALGRDIPDEIRANADEPIRLDKEATDFLSLKALIRRERLWAASFFVTGVWTNELTGVSGAPGAGQFQRWDEAASKPIETIRAARTSVKLDGGLRPNVGVFGAQVWDALLDHPDIVGRIDRGQTTGAAKVNRDAVAALFELDKVLVMDAIYNTAHEGATEANAFIGGKHALLVYAPPSPGLMTPSGGYTFAWRGRFGANAYGGRIKKLRMEPEESDRVEIQMAIDQKLTSADMGFLFLDAVS